MSRGSISSCFRVPLVARKNISLVSLWALQVSISGALLVAREYKTANVRKKIGRSKALRMCPTMNSRPLSTRRTRAPSFLAGTNLRASSQGPLPKLYYFSIFFFFFPQKLESSCLCQGSAVEESPCLPSRGACAWLRSRERAGKDPEQPVPSRAQPSHLASPVPPAAPGTRKGTRSPGEKGWHNLQPSCPTQLRRLPALPAQTPQLRPPMAPQPFGREARG